MKEQSTVGDVLAGLAMDFLPDRDPDRLAYEFLRENAGQIKEKTAELGVVVLEGPDFGERLIKALGQALVETGWEPRA